MNLQCPECGTAIDLDLVAELPDETSLTFVFQVAEGQMIQARTLSGVVASFDEMQKAIGEEMGRETTTLIERLETVGSELRITFKIVNLPASALEASRGETGTGSTGEASDIATGKAGDAQQDPQS